VKGKTFCRDSASGEIPVVDHLRNLIQARDTCISQCGVIEYRCAADCNGNPLGGEALDQQSVENDLTCVVGKI
jgi:hypothetical protein